jgi:3-hydroxyisobutyrate dehydrogenase-like beta-hydroxyacid dehydrogenase
MNGDLGFVGLGVMGSRMCTNLVGKSGRTVHVFDPVHAAVVAAVERGAVADESARSVGENSDVVFLSLPAIDHVEAVCEELASAEKPPSTIVDMSTSNVTRTRTLAARLSERGIRLVDAPVARRRQAAEDGTLLITVGAEKSTFDSLVPFLSCMGSDVICGGAVGNGQVLKILNNMVLFQNTATIAEALALGRAAGVDPTFLFDTLQLGSADSYALRTTARQTMLIDEYPEQAFPVDYAIKDLGLALELAADTGIETAMALDTMNLLRKAREAGLGAAYYPAILRVVERRV